MSFWGTQNVTVTYQRQQFFFPNGSIEVKKRLKFYVDCKDVKILGDHKHLRLFGWPNNSGL
jgi:hypothetical protein